MGMLVHQIPPPPMTPAMKVCELCENAQESFLIQSCTALVVMRTLKFFSIKIFKNFSLVFASIQSGAIQFLNFLLDSFTFSDVWRFRNGIRRPNFATSALQRPFCFRIEVFANETALINSIFSDFYQSQTNVLHEYAIFFSDVTRRETHS